MADNISVLDANSTTQVVKTTQTASVHTPHHIVDSITAGSVDVAGALPTGDNNIGNVDVASMPSDTFVAEAGALGKGVLLQGDDGTDRHNVAVDANGYLQVDITSGSVDITAGSVVVSSGSVVVTAGSTIITGGSVELTGALPAGTNTLGTVTANAGTGTFATVGTISSGSIDVHGALPTGDNNIGNVDIASGPTGANSLQVQGSTASGLAATGYPVRIAGQDSGSIVRALLADATGHLQTDVISGSVSVDDGGNTLTVDGTVTANAGTGTFGVSGTVTANAGTGTFATAGTISSGSIDIKGALPTGTNSIGKVEVTSGSVAITAGSVVVSSGSMVVTAGSTIITGGSVQITGALPAGTNTLGTVTANAGTGTFAVSGTVTANAGTGTFGVSGSVDTVMPVGANATQVQGTAASGTAATGYPVRVAGQDSGSMVRVLLADSAGHLQTDVISGSVSVDDGGNTLTVDGTVTANAGTGTFAIAGTISSGSIDIHGALPTGTNSIGKVEITGGSVELTAGSVVVSSGSMVVTAGSTIITGGSVELTGALPAGTNTLGTVTANAGTGTFATAGTISSGSIDIKGALPAGNNNIGNVDIVTGPTGATALEVQGTAACATAATGDPVRVGGQDSSANVRTLLTDTAGHLQVDILSGGGGTMTDDDPFTAGASPMMPVGGMFDDVSPDSVSEGDAGIFRMSANRNQYVTLRDAAGNERGLNVDASGAIAVTDGGSALTVDGSVAVSGSVDIQGALPAGNNNIGNVDIVSGSIDIQGALPAGTNNIGDVDIASGSVDIITGTGANAVQVQGTSASGTVATGYPVRIAGQSAGSTVYALLADSSGHLQVDVISGAVTATVSGSVDIQGALPTGTNALGTVQVTSGSIDIKGALPAGDNNIGNVDIVSGSVDVHGALPAGDNNIGNVDVASGSVDITTGVGANAVQIQGTSASGVVATGNPVRIAGQSAGSTVYALLADATGHLQVDVVSITAGSVDVAGALPAGNNNIGNVDIVSGSVDVHGALPAGNNNIGNVDIVSGSVDISGALPAGTNNIGDVDIASGSVDIIAPVAANAIHIQGTTTHDSAASGNPVQIGGVAETTRTVAVSDGDAVRGWFDSLGRQVVQVGVGYKDFSATSYTSEQTNASLIAGSAGLKLCVYDILVSTAASGTILLEESDGTTRVFGPLTLAANGGWQFNSAAGLELTSGCGLVATTACQGSSAVSVTVNYGVIAG